MAENVVVGVIGNLFFLAYSSCFSGIFMNSEGVYPNTFLNEREK